MPRSTARHKVHEGEKKAPWSAEKRSLSRNRYHLLWQLHPVNASILNIKAKTLQGPRGCVDSSAHKFASRGSLFFFCHGKKGARNGRATPEVWHVFPGSVMSRRAFLMCVSRSNQSIDML